MRRTDRAPHRAQCETEYDDPYVRHSPRLPAPRLQPGRCLARIRLVPGPHSLLAIIAGLLCNERPKVGSVSTAPATAVTGVVYVIKSKVPRSSNPRSGS